MDVLRRIDQLERRLPVAMTPDEIRIVCRALGELTAGPDAGSDFDAAVAICDRLQRGYRP